METDFRARSAGPRTLHTGCRAGDRHADAGCLPITRPDRPGIAAAVSSLLFSSGANIAESQQYATAPSGGTFFLRIEFQLSALAERFANLISVFGGLVGRFPMRWQLTRAGGLIRAATAASGAGRVLQEEAHR